MSSAVPAETLPVATRTVSMHVIEHSAPTLLSPLGWLPALSLVSAAGLLCLAAVNRLSASGSGNLEPVYWLSLLVIAGPIVARLLVYRAGRAERLGLVVVFGLDLYLVKILQSPFAFTYGDEFMHEFNANRIMQTGHLFSPNSLLPASALYPGLEAATTNLMRLTGLDTFGAGLVIIGLARLAMILALFLLYEQLSHSARVAGVACVLYAANANIVYWSAQYSYESLALPLAILLLFIVARRAENRWPAERLALTLTAAGLILAVVVTHHLASYFLAGALMVWVVLARLQRLVATSQADDLLERWWVAMPVKGFVWLASRVAGRPAAIGARPEPEPEGPTGLAVLAVAAVLFWLVFVANLTLSYLSPVFLEALRSVLQWIGGEVAARALFQPSDGGPVTPLVDRVIGISSVLLCLVGLPFGLRQVWRRSWHNPAVLFLTGAALAYFAALGLRFLPSAWEIANRSSEFLFVGLALVLAMGHLPNWPRMRRIWQAALTTALVVILAGGVIAGWPPGLRLAQVYEGVVDQKTLEPVGLAFARWTVAQLGPQHNFAADQTNGRFLLVYGQQNVLLAQDRSPEEVLQRLGPSLDDIDQLRQEHIEYVVIDRRLIADDTMAGFFFNYGAQWPLPDSELQAPQVYELFDTMPQVNRIADGGDVVLYDVRKLIRGTAQP